MSDNDAQYIRPILAIAAGVLFIAFGVTVWDADGWIPMVAGIPFVCYGIIKIVGIKVSQPSLRKQYRSTKNLPGPEKFAYTLNKAKEGNREAQYHLGMMYRLAIGATENLPESSKWINNAAQQGYAPAQYEMGNNSKATLSMPELNKDEDLENIFNHLFFEIYSAKNNPEAVEWYSKAAMQGCWKSCLELQGMFLFDSSTEVEKWHSKGMELLNKAAKNEDGEAQTHLGFMALTSGLTTEGGTSNFAQAELWFRKAAEKRDPEPLAMFHLGSMYENGHGVRKDRRRAFEWYVKAVEHGGKTMLYQFDFRHRFEIRLRLLFKW